MSIGCNTDSPDCGFLLCNNAGNRCQNSITSLRLTVEYQKLITLSRKSHISITLGYYHIQVRFHCIIDATTSHNRVQGLLEEYYSPCVSLYNFFLQSLALFPYQVPFLPFNLGDTLNELNSNSIEKVFHEIKPNLQHKIMRVKLCLQH